MPSIRYGLEELLAVDQDKILGRLAHHYATMGFASLWTTALDAWRTQLPVLRDAIRQLVQAHPAASRWNVLFEYTIPLRDRRPDALILADSTIFVIEFKVGAVSHDSAAIWQVQSYALDLRDFHPHCGTATIIPILVATQAEDAPFSERLLETQLRQTSFPVQMTNSASLGPCLTHFSGLHCGGGAAAVDPNEWENAVYSPTPTIIEAAQKLFGGHRVEEISHAFSDSLKITSKAVVDAISQSRREGLRTICFVTGIPGSGKTLVGLNAVHSPELLSDSESSAVFLSGNGPLVKVIRESLAREQASTHGVRRDEARDVASSFIANVHGFIKGFGIDRPEDKPKQHAIVFDEAQRAWSAKAVEKEHGKNISEPALVLDIMNRVPNWATVVALVGGGQEINSGEAGLPEWGRALAERANDWRVLVSPEVKIGGVSVAGQKLFRDSLPQNLSVTDVPELHLKIDVRSHRAKFIGTWVNETLLGNVNGKTGAKIDGDFPVVITRDISAARKWLGERQESASQRTGLLASSGAIRLRAYGLELTSSFRRGFSYPDWFLNPMGDVRSSYQLEVAATEFDCQGLEIDWAGVCWGGDMVIDPTSEKWLYRKFRGYRWTKVGGDQERQYLMNKYRVLLTRARRGMILWVPRGDAADKTLEPELFDATAAYLVRAGVPVVEGGG